MNDSIIFFDTETTGLLKPDASDMSIQPHMTEFYGAKVNRQTLEIEDELAFLCKPPVKLEEHIVKITGLTDEILANEPPFIGHYEKLCNFYLGVKEACAHNVSFDMGILYCELNRLGFELKFPWPFVWTCTIEKSMPILHRRIKLMDLYKHFNGTLPDKSHRAKDDVMTLINVYYHLREKGYID